jgi:hypothetical protein
MKYALIILGFILIAGIVCIPPGCQYFEEPQRYYKSHSDELYAGGWVPKIFPNDISEIHEQHDIDTNEVWLLFNRGNKNIDPEKINMSRLTWDQTQSIQFRKPFLSSWWFEGPVQQQPANDNALNAEYFKGSCGDGMTSYLALDRTSQKSYWWCP